MSKSDEQIVREALEYYGSRETYGLRHEVGAARNASAALDRLLSRCVPELPDGYYISRLSEGGAAVVSPWWGCEIKKTWGSHNYVATTATTIREACEAAIAKITQGPKPADGG